MGNGNAFIYGEKSSCASLQSSKTDYEQRTETIDIRPTPGTAPGTCLSAEVSYFFVSLSVGPPTLVNWKPKTLVNEIPLTLVWLLIRFINPSFTLMPMIWSSFKWSFLKAGVSKCVVFTYLGVEAGFISKNLWNPVKRNKACCTFNRFPSIFFFIPSLAEMSMASC